MSELGSIENVRSERQREHMTNTIGQGVCPFCKLDLQVNREIVFTGKFWRGWKNPFPYPHHRTHIVLATIEHVDMAELHKLSPEMWSEWGQANAELTKATNGGGIVMRFGDPKLNGSTLRHLHSHIQEPDETGFAIATFYKDDRLLELFKKAPSK